MKDMLGQEISVGDWIAYLVADHYFIDPHVRRVAALTVDDSYKEDHRIVCENVPGKGVQPKRCIRITEEQANTALAAGITAKVPPRVSLGVY